MTSADKTNRIKITNGLQAIFENESEENLLALARMLQLRLQKPQVYVTICGETSTGKSSLVNGLFNRILLLVSASPSTATVIHVACREKDSEEYFAIYRDATQEQIDRNIFERLSLNPIDELLRLQVRAKPEQIEFVGMQLFDTPGYNSVLAKHEEILKSFLPQSDIIVFVVGYRSGFGQVDQDLLELISDATVADPEIPVFLVVNRVPNNVSLDDSRIIEIVKNADDCLQRKPDLVLIQSATLENPEILEQSNLQIIPESDELWDSIANIIEDPERIDMVEKKLDTILCDLIEEADSIAERKELMLIADSENAGIIKNQIEFTKQARGESLVLIKETITRLKNQLPLTLQREITSMKKKLGREIRESEKWFGAEDCAQWITSHALTFEVRNMGRVIEQQIYLELDNLNRKLEDIANTAVKKIETTIRVKTDAAKKFAKNLIGEILKRTGGHAIRAGLKNLGGACGQAAGAGNLAKMAVKQVGKLVGKVFPRKVYNAIGRIFTKRMLAKLNIAVAVVIEAISYLRHVKNWKGELEKKVYESIDELEKEVYKDLMEEQIPLIEKSNIDGVHQIYDDLIMESERNLSENNVEEALRKVISVRAEINKYRKYLDSVS